jgi:hypothetical protein
MRKRETKSFTGNRSDSDDIDDYPSLLWNRQQIE